MKNLIFVSALLLTTMLNAQVVKIDNGIAFSSFDNENFPFLEDRIDSYAFLAGVDYLEKNWFYISSQVGFVQLGGRQLNRLLADEFQDVRETQHFMHLNSVFRAYLSGELGKLTVGVGPYVNVPLGNDEFDSRLFNGFSYERIHTGLKGEVGILKDIDRLRVGIMGSYLFDLTPVASTEFMDIGIDATSIFVSIGYRIADDQAKQ